MIHNINYIVAILITIIGLYSMIINKNLVKKLFAMGIFQASILLLYISMAKVKEGKVPILNCLNFENCPEIYTNPLPHILMLTAIVVGVATLAVGLAIVVMVKENLGSIDEDDITLNSDLEND